MFRRFVVAAVVLVCGSFFSAQTGTQAKSPVRSLGEIHTQRELEQTVLALDTELFTDYNDCADPAALDRFAGLLTPDIEFYHDQGGSTFGAAPLVAALRANVCGKVTRELVPASFRVYPMKNLGAIEFGTHRFFHPNDASHGRVSSGDADFVHLWVYRDGAWKLARVLSYDHRGAQ